MRVLQVINNLSVGGAETLMVNLAISIHSLGRDVDVLLLSDAHS